MLKKIVICLSLFLYAVELQAEADLQKERKVEAILDLSGIQKQDMQIKENFADQIKVGIKQNKKLTNEQVEKLYKLTMSELKPEIIIARLKTRLINEWSSKELDELYNFFNQEEVKKISRLEEDGTSINARPALIEYVKSLENNPPNKQRLQVITHFVKEAKVIESNVNTFSYFHINLFKALGKTLSDEEIDKLRKQMTPGTAQNIILAFLFVYRDVPLEDLQKHFSKYLTLKSLDKLNNVHLEEIDKHFQQWGFNVGSRIRIEFPQANSCN